MKLIIHGFSEIIETIRKIHQAYAPDSDGAWCHQRHEPLILQGMEKFTGLLCGQVTVSPDVLFWFWKAIMVTEYSLYNSDWVADFNKFPSCCELTF